MINIKVGDLFESDKDVLVNTINCVGVMGKGIALAFKKKFPKMFQEYKDACESGEVEPGTLYPYYEDGNVKVLNFPTKKHWRAKTKLEYVISGLDWFVENYEKLGINSIAFPALGCGNGGLDWEEVAIIMYDKLVELPIDIDIYAPIGTADKKLNIDYLKKNDKESDFPRLNNNWFLVIRVIQCLQNKKNDELVNKELFQLVCYILSRYESNLSISFQKSATEPYSNDVENMLEILLNEGIITMNDGGESYTIGHFDIKKYVFTDKDRDNANKTYKLLKKINANEYKLIMAIMYAYDDLKKDFRSITENMIVDYLVNWNKIYSVKEKEIAARDLIKLLNDEKVIKINYSKEFKVGLEMFL